MVDSTPWQEPRIRPLSQREFRLFQELIYREAGIALTDAKRPLLVTRLARRLRELGLGSYQEYFDRIQADEEERLLLLDAISTNETHFFRQPKQFEFLERDIIPQWRAGAAAGRMARSLRIWSAACSTGEEPYSLAMLLLEQFPPETGWRIQIVASDLSRRVLEQAVAGVWPIERMQEIPEKYLKRFMLRGLGAHSGVMKAGPELRATIQFLRLNLHGETYGVQGPFDLILCRNVMIYFDQAGKRRVVERLLQHLAPGGYLLVGQVESLHGISERVEPVIPTVYRLAGVRGAAAARAPSAPAVAHERLPVDAEGGGTAADSRSPRWKRR